VSSAIAEKKEEKETKVPLEKKLDKRGLLNLGYGYGINGLDVGYIGAGQHGGAYHNAAPVYEHQQQGYNQFAHGYGQPFYLGHQTNVQKTITHFKGVPVPYEVTKHVPYEVIKNIPYPVKVSLTQTTFETRHEREHSLIDPPGWRSTAVRSCQARKLMIYWLYHRKLLAPNFNFSSLIVCAKRNHFTRKPQAMKFESSLT